MSTVTLCLRHLFSPKLAPFLLGSMFETTNLENSSDIIMTPPVPLYISSFDLCFSSFSCQFMESVGAATPSPLCHPASDCNTSTPVLWHTDGQFGCNGPKHGRLDKCSWSCVWAGRAGGERPLKSRQLRRCAQSKFSAHVRFNPICMLLCLTSLHKLSTWSLTYVIWPCICFFFP